MNDTPSRPCRRAIAWIVFGMAVLFILAESIWLCGIMRHAPWAERIVSEDRAEYIHLKVRRLIEKHVPHDMDGDELPDLLELMMGSPMRDYYNGQTVEVLLRGELFRKSDFVYAGGRLKLQLQHRRNGAVGDVSPDTRVTLNGDGGTFTAIARGAFYENAFDPVTGELHGVYGTGTGGHVYYNAPDTPGRMLNLSAHSVGQRDLTVSYPVRVLGHPRQPIPVKTVTASPHTAQDSGLIIVQWEQVPGTHVGIAIEFRDYLGDWLIVAAAPATANECEFPDDVVAVNPPKPLTPEHFRAVPYDF